MITVMAKVVAKKDSLEAVRKELLDLVPPTRKEEGCLQYVLHQDMEDPAVFIFYERWESMSSLQRHMDSVHFKRYVQAVEGLIVDKQVHLLSALE